MVAVGAETFVGFVTAVDEYFYETIVIKVGNQRDAFACECGVELDGTAGEVVEHVPNIKRNGARRAFRVAVADEDVRMAIKVEVGHLNVSVIDDVVGRRDAFRQRGMVVRSAVAVGDDDIVDFVAQDEFLPRVATNVESQRARELVVVGVAVVRVGVGLVAAALGCGEQDACFGIEDFVSSIDFRMPVAIEVGKTDAHREVVVACVVACVGNPNGVAGIGCGEVVGIQLGVLAGSHNQSFSVGQFDQSEWTVAMCPDHAIYRNLCFQGFASAVIYVDGLGSGLALTVALHVEAHDFGDAVVVEVAHKRVDAAVDIVAR